MGRLRFALDHRWCRARLSGYADGELVQRARARAAHHLAECEECRAALRGLERLLSALGRLSPTLDDESPDLVTLVRRRLPVAPDD